MIMLSCSAYLWGVFTGAAGVMIFIIGVILYFAMED